MVITSLPVWASFLEVVEAVAAGFVALADAGVTSDGLAGTLAGDSSI